jgi:23S rRNA pseudouridine1911/1915/1917 synthase
MRLDRFLSRWFRHWSRSALARGVRAGQVTDAEGRALRASSTVRAGDVLHVWIPGLAADGPPPPFPDIVHEDERVVVVDKPPGMMCHPAGERFVHALIGLCRERWPGREVHLVHRIDAHTSGLVVLTLDHAANAFLKEVLRSGGAEKVYEALVRGRPTWETRTLDGPIGPAGGPVRIQMAVREDGLAARTHVRVLGTREGPQGPISRVRCQIETGRTHQIRVHLSHAGLPLLGDRLYGPRATLFLDIREDGLQARHLVEAGAPRHALHSASLRIPHPDGGELSVARPPPADMQRWWETPEVLPLDGHRGEDRGES